MSVLQCDRRGCEGIMCYRLSHTYGYICPECYGELIDRADEIVDGTLTIESFMEESKKADNLNDCRRGAIEATEDYIRRTFSD